MKVKNRKGLNRRRTTRQCIPSLFDETYSWRSIIRKAVSLTLVVVWWIQLTTAPPIAVPTAAITTTTTLSSPPITGISTPWTKSNPPDPIKLFDTQNPAISNRHKCLVSIRQRQEALLNELIPSTSSLERELLLVDPAYHGNVGDHMLTVAELDFLTKYHHHHRINQCHYVQAGLFVPPCDTTIFNYDYEYNDEYNNDNEKGTTTRVALWHAGGNWGDLWISAQDVRIASFQTLLEHNFSIVSLPQSLYYSSKVLQERHASRIKEQIALGLGLGDPFALESPDGRSLAQSRVTFTWRERESYHLAQQLYPFVQNRLIPDMAFQLGPYRSIPNDTNADDSVDILMLLRNDHESTTMKKNDRMRTSRRVRTILTSLPGDAADVTFRIVDWGDRLELFHSDNIFFTSTAIQLLSLGKVVVCDRLHAAILSYLSGLPLVYLDQVSGKLTKTLSAAFEDGGSGQSSSCALSDTMVARAVDLEDALRKAIDFLHR